jgi:hypothetical protein
MDATGRTADGRKHTASLEHAVKFAGWPSPQAHDGRRPGADLKSTQGGNLSRDAHLAGWATPTSRDFRSESATDEFNEKRWNHPRGKPLSAEAILSGWATPKAEEHMERNLRGNLTLGGQAKQSTAAMASGGASRLNPLFSLWLQGYPPAEWASCAARAIASSRRSRQNS